MAARSSGIDRIQGLIADLARGCGRLTDDAVVSKRVSAVGQIAARHEQLRGLYQTAQAELNRQLQSFTHAQYSDVIPPDFLTLQGLNTDLNEKVWNVFQDNILTLYPHAPINYGTALAGVRIAWQPTEIAAHRELCAKYPQLRKIRGDGNCFYTSFATGYLTWLCQDKTRFVEAIGALFEIGVFPGSAETFQVLLDLAEDPLRLERYITNNQKMLPLVSYLRHRAAHHMVTHEKDFSSDILGMSVDKYLHDCVLRMGHDADHPEIAALCASLKFPLEIYDNRASGLARTPFMEDAGEPRMGIFRNGAHYSFLQRDQVALPVHPPAAHHGSSSHSPSYMAHLLAAKPVAPVLPHPAEIKRILTIKYNCGYGHSIYIRGTGSADLSWDKGIKLRNAGPDTWIYETDKDFDALEFKALVDDSRWEDGSNHHLARKKTMDYTPKFK